jgi:Cof subfamily protein (haloacid dehalogenase superfamily)
MTVVPAHMLALDVDGTLLTSDATLSPRTRAALNQAAAAGWHIVLVTGRPLAIALPVVHDVGLGEYVVAANGATVAEIVTGETIYQACLPGDLAAEAVKRARQAVPGIGSAVTTQRGSVRELGFDRIAPLSETDSVLVPDACPSPDDVVFSVVLFAAGIETRTLAVVLNAVLPDGVEVSLSGLTGSVELTAPGVNKASGIAQLCRRLGVNQRDVVAFGDGPNDHEMLSWAGLGLAMGNADAETKALADEVTTSNDDDGIALVVERLLEP